MPMKKFILTHGFALLVTSLVSQNDFKVYKPANSGSYSLQNIFQGLVGDGVILKNYSVSKTWSDEAFGYFEDNKSRLGMKKGLIMTTGGISGLCGSNTKPDMSNYTHRTADPNFRGSRVKSDFQCKELEKYLGKNQKTFDAVVIEIDIIPTADTLNFNYVFGSEEYDEFVGTNYNDVFAFFISGKDINDQINLAVVPNSNDPVSVNTINNGSKTQRKRSSNATYYVSNLSGELGIEYDGLTKLMEIKRAVVPYETYHLKLAIADAGDNSYDSGVLIEGKSIVSYEKSYSVLYEKNETTISAPYKNLLNALAKEYKTKTNSNISITGHTDGEGELDYNKELSCKRANEVRDYLKSKGIAEDRLIVDCKGETMPAHANNTEEGKHMNRRVELKLLGNDKKYLAAKKSELVSQDVKSELINNVPNPFNGVTQINANILNSIKEARLIITDISGKQIKDIFMLERGNTSVIFDSAGLPQGIYLATLFCDGISAGSLKMVLQ